LLAQQNGEAYYKPESKLRQGMLPLEIVSKGRFEKSEPTIHTVKISTCPPISDEVCRSIEVSS
jgi:hypothetical protein